MPCDSVDATEALKKILGAKVKCPMCGNGRFNVLEGYIRNDVQQELAGFVLGGGSIPAVAIVCTRCGFISQHAVGIVHPESFDKARKDDAKQ